MSCDGNSMYPVLHGDPSDHYQEKTIRLILYDIVQLTCFLVNGLDMDSNGRLDIWNALK